MSGPQKQPISYITCILVEDDITTLCLCVCICCYFRGTRPSIEKLRSWNDAVNSQASKHPSFLTILSIKIFMLSVIRKLQRSTHIRSKLPPIGCFFFFFVVFSFFFFFISPSPLCTAYASRLEIR